MSSNLDARAVIHLSHFLDPHPRPLNARTASNLIWAPSCAPIGDPTCRRKRRQTCCRKCRKIKIGAHKKRQTKIGAHPPEYYKTLIKSINEMGHTIGAQLGHTIGAQLGHKLGHTMWGALWNRKLGTNWGTTLVRRCARVKWTRMGGPRNER